MKRIWMALAALTLSMTGAAAADFPEDLGPDVGTTIPHDLKLNDADSAKRSLEDLTGENGLVLLFNRSLDWCPFCQAQVMEINKTDGEIEARGYEIAVVTYDSVNTLSQFAERRGINITLLSDPDSAAIDAFGLRNEGYKDNPKAYGAPHPAIFIVSPAGEIRAKLYEENYKDRPPASAVLDAIDAG